MTFLLGGHDLEMETIAGLVESVLPGSVIDRNLGWGARASAYRTDIAAAIASGSTPVLVELEWDLELPRDQVVEVDHHGARSGLDVPTSLEQVFKLIGCAPAEWTRWFDLVSANDRGHVRAMEQLDPPATCDEIRDVRERDIRAQGATEAQIASARTAVAAAVTIAGGKLTIVALDHGRASIAADLLHKGLGGPGYEVLVVTSPDQVNVWGPGAVIAWLDAEFPGGWYGGELPTSGFWGRSDPAGDLVTRLESRLLSDA